MLEDTCCTQWIHIGRYAHTFFFFPFYPSKLFNLAVQPEEWHDCSFLLLRIVWACCRSWHGTESSTGALALGRVSAGAAGEEAKQTWQNTNLGGLGHPRAAQGQAGQPLFQPRLSSAPFPPRRGLPCLASPGAARGVAGMGREGRARRPGRPQPWRRPLRGALLALGAIA